MKDSKLARQWKINGEILLRESFSVFSVLGSKSYKQANVIVTTDGSHDYSGRLRSR